MVLAQEMGLLRAGVITTSHISEQLPLGMAYDNKKNIAAHFFMSQQHVQKKWREFAVNRGFALCVGYNSSKEGEGNAKYAWPAIGRWNNCWHQQ